MTETGSQRLAVFQRERPHLLCVAFRILGSEPDAEDVVQETWIKYERADTSSVRNLQAWLTTVTTRLCLDVLRRRREIPQEDVDLSESSVDYDGDPEQTALLAYELTAAFTIVLEELTPPQRVALVLHDAFGVPFEEIAHILGTTDGSAKKLASRARERVRRSAVVAEEDSPSARHVVEAFLLAAQKGDTDRLVALLDPDVVRIADPQVLPPRSAQRMHGVQAVVAEASRFRANALRGRVAQIDGRPGIAILHGSEVQTALLLHVKGERIVQYDVIADPQRLALLKITHIGE